ncbi:Tetratricopeptide repeat-containing protein [Flavobacterium longum]|uniref:tetratricopeptide repeat protein n=1 Tax=Flavobacterium longum TaxID=1299340 RepID=UPI0039E81FD9
MNSAEYTFLLSHPDAVDERATDALEKIITEFPYFQSARALRLKGLYNQNSFQYNYALKVTAAYTTDRSVLFDFITSDTFTAIAKTDYEAKQSGVEALPSSEFVAAPTETVETENLAEVDLAKQSILTSIREAEQVEKPAVDEVVEKTDATEEINPEEFGPIGEEPQFLPEAIAPVEFAPVAVPEIAMAETDEPMVESQDIEAEIQPDTIAHEAEEVAAEITSSETKLEIGKPLEFSKDETHSFAEWLQLSKFQPIVRDESPAENTVAIEEKTEEKTEEKISKDALIDRFIEANPKMPKINPEAAPVAIEQKDDHTALMTETLARVYLEQRKYQKAIQAYEILILKYPEKSSFFADRISEIKLLQQNNIL